MLFDSVENVKKEFLKFNYILSDELARSLCLANFLQKPLLLEGDPGIGKTELAIVLSKIMNNKDPIRLQCYEGIDFDSSVVSWDFKKQLLYIEMMKNSNWKDNKSDIYSEEFISFRPISKSIMSDNREVLLIDEIDKSDDEFESFLLEVLSSYQITIPEIGTIKAKHVPIVILTSNNIRDLSDALRRRCLYNYICYPSISQQTKILKIKVPNISSNLCKQIVDFIKQIKQQDLKKYPSISEMLDWANTLVLMNKDNIDKKIIKETLNVLIKTKQDLDTINENISKMTIKQTVKNNDKDWEFD